MTSLPLRLPPPVTLEVDLSSNVGLQHPPPTCSLRVVKPSALPPLDYEDQAQRDGFRLRIRVSDGLHEAISNVFVQLVDQNDHPPDIVGPSEVRIAEDVRPGTIVARYSVSDRDAGDRARILVRIPPSVPCLTHSKRMIPPYQRSITRFE
ncbi:Hmr-1p [Parelaphostrongylus tenuis]|uniref:Hmr-1p n=1 Tax=Parelaphostrongylus tenuis TaxID=148309 RepID=A0AAD5QD40_PARTN|nr:Hmr-1p [Parelaphostrongylus tenuis]